MGSSTCGTKQLSDVYNDFVAITCDIRFEVDVQRQMGGANSATSITTVRRASSWTTKHSRLFLVNRLSLYTCHRKEADEAM